MAFAGGILNSYHQFAIPAFTPVLLNICLISSAFFLAPHFDEPLMALAWGVALAGLAQLLIQFPSLIKLGLMPVPRVKRGHEGIRKIVRLMIPAIFGSSVAQINLLLDTVIARNPEAGNWLFLIPGDSPIGFRLPLGGLAHLSTINYPNVQPRDPLSQHEELPDRHALLTQRRTVALENPPMMVSPTTWNTSMASTNCLSMSSATSLRR